MLESRELTERTDWWAKQTPKWLPSRKMCRTQELDTLHAAKKASLWHHTIDRLEERGEERCSLKGCGRANVNATKNGTASKAVLGKPLGRWPGHMGFPECVEIKETNLRTCGWQWRTWSVLCGTLVFDKEIGERICKARQRCMQQHHTIVFSVLVVITYSFAITCCENIIVDYINASFEKKMVQRFRNYIYLCYL